MRKSKKILSRSSKQKSKKKSSRSSKQKSRKVVLRAKRQKSKCYPKVYDRKTKRCRKSRKTKRTDPPITPGLLDEVEARHLAEKITELVLKSSLDKSLGTPRGTAA